MDDKCLQCGKCCSSYLHLIGDKLPSEDMRQLLEWRGIKLRLIDDLWFANDTNARCKHLNKDNTCAIYDERPQICKDYPKDWSKSLLTKGCGFK